MPLYYHATNLSSPPAKWKPNTYFATRPSTSLLAVTAKLNLNPANPPPPQWYIHIYEADLSDPSKYEKEEDQVYWKFLKNTALKCVAQLDLPTLESFVAKFGGNHLRSDPNYLLFPSMTHVLMPGAVWNPTLALTARATADLLLSGAHKDAIWDDKARTLQFQGDTWLAP